MEKVKFEKLPFEFQGIWINDAYGGFHPPLIERFKPEMPRDLLYEHLKESNPELADKPHSHANPKWISKEEFERHYGQVEAVYVAPRFLQDKVNWEDYKLERIVIWTDKFVVTVEEYDGAEYFVALPRNPPNFAGEGVTCGVCGRSFGSDGEYERHILKIGTTRWCVYKMKERVEKLLQEMGEADEEKG